MRKYCRGSCLSNEILANEVKYMTSSFVMFGFYYISNISIVKNNQRNIEIAILSQKSLKKIKINKKFAYEFSLQNI